MNFMYTYCYLFDNKDIKVKKNNTRKETRQRR